LADGETENLALVLPEEGASANTWGAKLNDNLDVLDEIFDETTGHAHTGVPGEGPQLKRTSLAGLSGGGLVVSVDANSFTARQLAAGAGIAITNPQGVAGDPTPSLHVTTATAESAVADGDEVPFADASASNATRKATRTEFLNRALHTGPRLVVVSDGSGSGTYALDLTLGTYRVRQVTGNTTFQFTNPPAAGAFGFIVELINGGSATITWPAAVKWPSGVAPVLTPSGTDVLVFITRDGGATWRGVLTMSDSR
jgi:hypothetical protein